MWTEFRRRLLAQRERPPAGPRIKDWSAISRETAIARAVAIVAVVAVVAAVFAAPWLAAASSLGRAALIVLGVPALYAIYAVALRAFSRARYRGLLGEWLYVTTTDLGVSPASPEHGYGFLRVAADSAGELDFSITIFPDALALLGFASGFDPPTRVVGQATSRATRFDEREGILHAVYATRFEGARPGTEGRLALAVTSDRGLSGRWVSEPNGALAAGRLIARRLADFPTTPDAIEQLVGAP